MKWTGQNQNQNQNQNHETSSIASSSTTFQKNEKLVKRLLSNVQVHVPSLPKRIPNMMSLSSYSLSSTSTSTSTSTNHEIQQQQQLQLQLQNQDNKHHQHQNHIVTAAIYAKNAPHAGYLSKLGGSISEYKRRFFVLKPTTCLYYFLSPNDLEPRGCIDLEEDFDFDDSSACHDKDDDDKDDDDDDCEYDDFYGDISDDRSVGDNERNTKEHKEQDVSMSFLKSKGKDDHDNNNGSKKRLEVNSLGCLPDGRFRFEILLPLKVRASSRQHLNDSLDYLDPSNNPEEGGDENEPRERQQQHEHNEPAQPQEQRRRIVLEARNEQVGKEWMKHIRRERLSYSKMERKRLVLKIKKLQRGQKLLNDKINELRLVEEDRDGAIQDAKEWKNRLEQLDSALGILKRWMSKPPLECDDDSNDRDGSRINDSLNTNTGQNEEYALLDKKDDYDESRGRTKKQNLQKPNSLSIEKDDLELEELYIPGTNFSSLSNICRGMRENLRLTSKEANAALGDINEANEKFDALSKRMAKAEKYICKLWEENCSMRDVLKKKKSEKKVLVKEVLGLMNKAKEDQAEINALQKDNESLRKEIEDIKSRNHKSIQQVEDDEMEKSVDTKKITTPKRRLGTPEKNLLRDLENDIDATLRDYHQLIEPRDNDSYHSLEMETERMDIGNAIDLSCIEEETEPPKPTSSEKSTPTVSNAAERKTVYTDYLPHKMFEPRDGNSSESDDSAMNNKSKKRTFSPLRPKSLLDEIALQEDQEIDNAVVYESLSLDATSSSDIPMADEAGVSDSSQLNTSEISHPLNKLDEDSLTIPSELSLKSLVTDNGEATSRLVCPLMDVKHGGQIAQDANAAIYHLTFYSSKIGLQFQKVPNKMNNSGALSDAMSADINTEGESVTASSRTDTELRLIASLSNQTQPNSTKEALKDNTCPVIFPKDIVLVCGFNGFDDTANNHRPSLGARLIAFDGISIERGPWTFDTVRKAIKARQRPLTLSFRDDYLTMEQRTILTRAAADVAGTNQASQRRKKDSGIPRFINATHKDILDYSKSATHLRSDSVCSDTNNDHLLRKEGLNDESDIDASVSTENNSRTSENWKAFSDAGSSSIFSRKFAPLMKGLVAGMKDEQKSEAFTPEYFRRAPDSLNSKPNHREFMASLL